MGEEKNTKEQLDMDDREEMQVVNTQVKTLKQDSSTADKGDKKQCFESEGDNNEQMKRIAEREKKDEKNRVRYCMHYLEEFAELILSGQNDDYVKTINWLEKRGLNRAVWYLTNKDGLFADIINSEIDYKSIIFRPERDFIERIERINSIESDWLNRYSEEICIPEINDIRALSRVGLCDLIESMIYKDTFSEDEWREIVLRISEAYIMRGTGKMVNTQEILFSHLETLGKSCSSENDRLKICLQNIEKLLNDKYKMSEQSNDKQINNVNLPDSQEIIGVSEREKTNMEDINRNIELIVKQREIYINERKNLYKLAKNLGGRYIQNIVFWGKNERLDAREKNTDYRLSGIGGGKRNYFDKFIKILDALDPKKEMLHPLFVVKGDRRDYLMFFVKDAPDSIYNLECELEELFGCWFEKPKEKKMKEQIEERDIINTLTILDGLLYCMPNYQGYYENDKKIIEQCCRCAWRKNIRKKCISKI